MSYYGNENYYGADGANGYGHEYYGADGANGNGHGHGQEIYYYGADGANGNGHDNYYNYYNYNQVDISLDSPVPHFYIFYFDGFP